MYEQMITAGVTATGRFERMGGRFQGTSHSYSNYNKLSSAFKVQLLLLYSLTGLSRLTQLKG